VSQYQWLLFLHVTGAFFLTGAVVVAGTLNLAAQRRERPSEIALLLGLTRFVVPAISLGALLTIVFGLWLVRAAHAGYGFDQLWVVAAVVLWIVGNAMGGAGGRRERRTREFAARLAGEGDAPSPELKARMRDPLTLALSYGAGVAILVILALMIWKPGA
jgi:uncharacterized membrane protein